MIVYDVRIIINGNWKSIALTDSHNKALDLVKKKEPYNIIPREIIKESVTMYYVEIHGSFFNDAGWDYEPVRLDVSFSKKSEAWAYAEKVQSGEIEVQEWCRIQDPNNTVTVVED
jgi:hypothetical protein